jgi:hypothetical protein
MSGQSAVAYDCRDMPTIGRFMDSNAFIRGLVGPLGGGKSSGCVWDLTLRGVRQEPMLDGHRRSRWVVIRNTNKQLEDSTIRTFLKWFPPHIYGDWRPSKGNYVLRQAAGAIGEPAAEIEFQFRALDRPDQVGNLLSTEYTGGWINEGREVPWAIFEALMGRVGRFPALADMRQPGWSGIISDTNPPDTDSKWFKFFEEEDHTESVEALSKEMLKLGLPPVALSDFYAIFKQPSGLGPLAENLKNLTPGYYARQQIGKSDDWIKVYLKGEYGFTIDGMQVFPEYSDGIHCPDNEKLWPKTLRNVPIYRSYDFGLTPACVFSQVTPSGRWIIVDELVSKSMGFDQFSDIVLQHSNQYYQGSEFIDIGDPAGNQRSQTDTKTCFQIAHAKDIWIQPAPQTLSIRLEGTRRPMRMLIDGRPQFQLHPRCKQLRKALLGGYHYRRMHVTGERYTNEPDKNEYSHVADALGYAGAWIFGPQLRTPSKEEQGDRESRVHADRTRSSITGY